MATCDNGHEAITFDSPFSALCPICNLVHDKLQKADKDLLDAQQEIDEMQGELESVEARADEVAAEYAAYRKAHPEA